MLRIFGTKRKHTKNTSAESTIATVVAASICPVGTTSAKKSATGFTSMPPNPITAKANTNGTEATSDRSVVRRISVCTNL